MAWLWQNTELLSCWAGIGLFFLTLAVSVFGVWQFYEGRRFSREIAAKAVYAGYLQLAFENPQFANPDIADVDYEALLFSGDRVQFERYEWFVSILASAYEEIAELTRDPAWKTEIEANLRYHKCYFQSSHYRRSGYVQNVGNGIARLVRLIGDEPATPPQSPST